MTVADNPTRELLDRRQQVWARQPSLHYDQVTDWPPPSWPPKPNRSSPGREEPGVQRQSQLDVVVPGVRPDAMNQAACDDCLQHEADIRADRARAKPLPGGGDRRPAVEAWMDRVGR